MYKDYIIATLESLQPWRWYHHTLSLERPLQYFSNPVHEPIQVVINSKWEYITYRGSQFKIDFHNHDQVVDTLKRFLDYRLYNRQQHLKREKRSGRE